MKKILVLLFFTCFLTSCTTLHSTYNPQKANIKDLLYLSEQIKKARVQANYSQLNFSAALDVPEKYLIDIEDGKILPDVFTFQKIIKLTNRPLEWFFRE